MSEEAVIPGSPEGNARILAAIGEAEQPRNEAGQFVSDKPQAPADEQPVETATESVPEGADAAPDESQPSGENDAQADTEVAPPAVEPPASWSDERKAKFRELPPELQEYTAQRERERDAEVRRGQDEVAKAK